VDFRQPGEFPEDSRLRARLLHEYLIAPTSVKGEGSSIAKSSLQTSNGHRVLQYQGERCDVNVLDVAKENPDLTTFVSLVKTAGLADLFLCAGPFTVLAPTNDAFDDLDPALLRDLLRPRNKEQLQEVLLYHILPGYQPSTSFTAGPTETLLLGFDMQVEVDPLTFDNANVVDADAEACNGVLHTIDTVLSPDDDDFCDAFDFSNRRRRLQDGGENCETNILDTAREYPELSIAVSLLTAADLQDVFSCSGPFTALLPSNSAFDNLNPDFVTFLLDPDNQEDLQDLLLYHILPEATLTTDFTEGPAESLLPDYTIDVTLSPIQFDGVNVVTPDITACNGYIHILNAVLSPFGETEAPIASPIVEPTAAPKVDQTKAPKAAPVTPPDLPTAAPVPGATAAPAGPDASAAPAGPGATAAPVIPATAAPSMSTPGSDTPSMSPVSAGPPVDPTMITVRVEDYYISYVAPGATRAPTQEEYNEMVLRTSGYFDYVFRDRFTSDPTIKFLGTKAASDFTLYGAEAGIPEERFNIYINFSVSEVMFANDSTVPDVSVLFGIMMDSISGSAGANYITSAVQAYTGSPFESTNEVYFAASQQQGTP
jgi:transforming growth factor-beta-induced protein